MFVLIILKHLTKFGSFRMEYCDTSRGVYASTGYSQVDIYALLDWYSQVHATYMPHVITPAR